jgi:glycerate kinase
MDGVSLEVWSDVENPLIGPQGATAVFGPQKGYLARDIQEVDGWIADFAGCLMPD